MTPPIGTLVFPQNLGLGGALPQPSRAPDGDGLIPMNRRFAEDAASLAIVLLLVGTVYFSTIRPGHDWGDDFSMYIIHARNIALRQPYTQTGYLLDPEITLQAWPASYPPVFPLLLAPVYRAFGLNYLALKILVQAILLLSLCPYYVLARLRGLSPLASSLVVGAFGLSALMLQVKESILAEGPYMLVAGAALVAMVVAYERRWDETKPARSAMVIVCLTLLAYGTRTVGLTLVIAFGAYELWRARRIRRFGVYVLGGLAAALLFYTFAIYDSRGYGGQFAFQLGAYLRNAIYYARSPGIAVGRRSAGVPLSARDLGFAVGRIRLLPAPDRTANRNGALLSGLHSCHRAVLVGAGGSVSPAGSSPPADLCNRNGLAAG